jgi:hypothetical protein
MSYPGVCRYQQDNLVTAIQTAKDYGQFFIFIFLLLLLLLNIFTDFVTKG